MQYTSHNLMIHAHIDCVARAKWWEADGCAAVSAELGAAGRRRGPAAQSRDSCDTWQVPVQAASRVRMRDAMHCMRNMPAV